MRIFSFLELIFLAFFSFSLLFLSPTVTFAAGEAEACPPYGSGKDCATNVKLLLNTKVQNPADGTFVDNLTESDQRYGPNRTIRYEVGVTNSGTSKLSTTIVTATLPHNTKLAAGPGEVNFQTGIPNFSNSYLNPKYNEQNRTVTYEVKDLQPNETRLYFVDAQVASKDAFSSDQVFCDTFKAKAVANGQKEIVAEDASSVCIEPTQGTTTSQQPGSTTKGGLKVYAAPPAQATQTTPKTGPELSLLAFIPTGLAGIYLRRKSS